MQSNFRRCHDSSFTTDEPTEGDSDALATRTRDVIGAQ